MGWGSIKKKKKMGKGGLLTPVSASAPPKVDVVDNGVEETTPLLTQPMQLPSVTAVPIGGDVKVTTMVTTTGVTEIFEEDCVGWLFSLLLNVAWIVFGGGIPVAVLYLVGGIIFCLTIVGFPCGLQLLKLARLALFPFGNAITKFERDGGEGAGSVSADCFCHNLGNILFLPLSIVLLVVHLLAALVCACTIVGIPFSYAHLKLASLAVCPFGRDQDSGGGTYERIETTTTTTTTSNAGFVPAGGGGLP